MPDLTEKTQWHPAFVAALQAELDDYRRYLHFIPERQLTTEPLRVDMLVIKKLQDVKIDKNIGRIFLRDNLLEFKAPGDSLKVADYNKVFGYAYLYAYLEKLDIRDITVTYVVSAHPDSVISYLSQRAEISVKKVSDGLYYVLNEIMPVQILTTTLLPEQENIWLTALTDKLQEAQFERVIAESHALSVNIGALLHAMANANPEVLKEEREKMSTRYEAVLDELGLVDKKEIAKLAAQAEKAEEEKAKLAAQLTAQLAQSTELAAQSAQLAAQTLAEITKLKKDRQDSARDMLLCGTPVAYISKWTSLSEYDINRMKAGMDITTVSKDSPDDSGADEKTAL